MPAFFKIGDIIRSLGSNRFKLIFTTNESADSGRNAS